MFQTIVPAVRAVAPSVLSVAKTMAIGTGRFGIILAQETAIAAAQSAAVYGILGCTIYVGWRIKVRSDAAAARKVAEETGEQIIATKAHELAQAA